MNCNHDLVWIVWCLSSRNCGTQRAIYCNHGPVWKVWCLPNMHCGTPESNALQTGSIVWKVWCLSNRHCGTPESNALQTGSSLESLMFVTPKTVKNHPTNPHSSFRSTIKQLRVFPSQKRCADSQSMCPTPPRVHARIIMITYAR